MYGATQPLSIHKKAKIKLLLNSHMLKFCVFSSVRFRFDLIKIFVIALIDSVRSFNRKITEISGNQTALGKMPAS